MGKPNVIVIMSDQHTPNVTACYGNKNVKTPNLDSLAGRGILFENAYCNNPVCVPSRMSMLTGLHSSKINVWSNCDCLSAHYATWPLLMRLAGYETVICGRNHMLWGDRLNGFGKRLCGDESKAIPYIKPGFTQLGRKAPQGLDIQLGIDDAAGHAVHDIKVTEYALEYLRNPPGNPFALFIGLYQPHAPFAALGEYFGQYSDLETPSRREEAVEEPYDKLIERLDLKRDIPEKKLSAAVRAYYAMVTHVDDLIGRIIRQTAASGLLENTVIIYTSDHGEMLGRHQLWHKMNFYEDSVRVPLVFSCPSRFGQGIRVKSNVSLIDIFPTLMDIAENKEEIGVDGHSLIPFLENRNPAWNNSVISESIGVERGKPGRMLKRDNFKLIYYHQGKPILFDLDADPGELNNLADSGKHRELLKGMLDELMESWDVAAINRAFENSLKHVYFHHKLMDKE